MCHAGNILECDRRNARPGLLTLMFTSNVSPLSDLVFLGMIQRGEALFIQYAASVASSAKRSAKSCFGLLSSKAAVYRPLLKSVAH